MSSDTMKQALDDIKATNKRSSFWLVPASELNKTVTALRLAIEQAEKQEPVAWQWLDSGTFRKSLPASAEPGAWRALYTTPPQRQPLTDEAIQKLRHNIDWTSGWSYNDFARAIERKHGIGGGE